MNDALLGNTPGASDPDPVSTGQQRIAELARQNPTMGFTSLNHHLSLSWLYEALRRTRQNGATGVDGQTAQDYHSQRRANLLSLLERAKSGAYVAPPVRRVHIPKGTGSETRPLGIPTFEDKVLQRAVAMLLEPIYEQDFYDGSYGFRPGKSAHQALEALRNGLMDLGGGWILDVDIRKFFDTLEHSHLRELLRLRVCDGVVLRLIGKWLKAGVLEDGELSYPEAGTPQGGVISPLLANVYLHYVLDEWFEQVVKPCLQGRAFLVRYADDFVMAFAREDDARRVLEALPKRFAKFGLTIHPDKTRLVRFARPPRRQERVAQDAARPGTFSFLGFTHYWARSRQGHWIVRRKTASDRLGRAIMKISHWCRKHRHLPIPEQHRALSQKLRGHYAYFGVTGNYPSLSRYRRLVVRVWRKWLSRRSWKAKVTWDGFRRLERYYGLPPPRVVHSVARRRATLT